MKGPNMTGYLSQFYTSGPYLHKSDNAIPFYAAFFSANNIKNEMLLSQLDDVIARMMAVENIFYREMNVSNCLDFNAQYLTGAFDKTRTDITDEQKIILDILQFFKTNFVFKLSLMRENIINTLPSLENMLGKTGGLEAILNHIAPKLNFNEEDTVKLVFPEIIEAFNTLIGAKEKRKEIIEKEILVNMSVEEQGFVKIFFREMRLQPGKINSEDVFHYSIKKDLNEYLRKGNAEILFAQKGELLNYLKGNLTKILNKYKTITPEFKNKTKEIIINTFLQWFSSKAFLASFFYDAEATKSTMGEFGISFSINLISRIKNKNIDSSNIDELMREVQSSIISQATGTIDKTRYNPITKQFEATNVIDKVTGKSRPQTSTAKLASDISIHTFFTKDGKPINIQVKDSWLDAANLGETVTIKDSIAVSTLLNNIMATGDLDQEQADKFAYVLVNNMFRINQGVGSVGGTTEFLNKFIANISNFYLQTEVLKQILYSSKATQGGTIGNSFFIYKGDFLIPMSHIFKGIRSYLTQETNNNLINISTLNAKTGNLNSFFSGSSGIPVSSMLAEKGAIQNQTPNWVGPKYGDSMLNTGIKYGMAMYNQLKIPSVTLNIGQLVNTIGSMVG